jgi:peptidoglycan-N-acetylglucosamine deacetylase
MYFLMTNDVEGFSIPLNKIDINAAKEVYKVGLPRLLDVYSKQDIKCTFYFTGKMAKIVPEAIELVKEHGHDIGCHGYDHSPNRALDLMNLNEQIEELQKAKKIIESIAGKIYDFRAPALRVNEYTITALERTGFNTDSSIASQRFDGPLSFGSKKKLNWLIAPRAPYYPSNSSIFKKGDSKILEIPISSFMFSYIGSTMRASPSTLKYLEYLLFRESKATEKPVVFLFHPNECLDPICNAKPARRANNIVEYVFADIVRQKLKTRNLGTRSTILLNNLIQRAKDADFEFVTIQEYKKLKTGSENN